MLCRDNGDRRAIVRNAQRERQTRTTTLHTPRPKCLGNSSTWATRYEPMTSDRQQLGRRERTNATGSVSVGSGRSGRTTRDVISCTTEAPSTPTMWRCPLLGRQYPATDTRGRQPTPHRHPPSPIGGPRVRNDYARPYVLEFFGRCVDIHALFLCLFPTWGLFCS